MHRPKFMLSILLVLMLILTTGCVRGDIVLDISRTGSAELSSKIMVISILRDNLKPLKEQFAQDGFAIMDVKESGMEGFHAVRNFSNIGDMKNLAVFQGLNLQESLGKNNTNDSTGEINIDQRTKPAKLTVEKGLFTNTYRIDTNIDLGSQYGIAQKDDNFVVKNILRQVDLKFVLKLPTKTIKNNAYEVSPDGRTLIWHLALGENNQIVADLTMLNLFNIGAMLGIVICILAYVFMRRSGLFARHFMK